MADRYGEPGYCDRTLFSDDAREWCNGLAAHYSASDNDNGERPGVCDAADFNSAGTISGDERIDGFRSRLARACDQVLAGETPDRPDLVACFEVTDELGGTTAGLIPQGECERLAMTDEPTDDLTALARTRWQDECADQDLRAERGERFVALCEERAEQYAALPDGS